MPTGNLHITLILICFPKVVVIFKLLSAANLGVIRDKLRLK